MRFSSTSLFGNQPLGGLDAATPIGSHIAYGCEVITAVREEATLVVRPVNNADGVGVPRAIFLVDGPARVSTANAGRSIFTKTKVGDGLVRSGIGHGLVDEENPIDIVK